MNFLKRLFRSISNFFNTLPNRLRQSTFFQPVVSLYDYLAQAFRSREEQEEIDRQELEREAEIRRRQLVVQAEIIRQAVIKQLGIRQVIERRAQATYKPFEMKLAEERKKTEPLRRKLESFKERIEPIIKSLQTFNNIDSLYVQSSQTDLDKNKQKLNYMLEVMDGLASLSKEDIDLLSGSYLKQLEQLADPTFWTVESYKFIQFTDSLHSFFDNFTEAFKKLNSDKIDDYEQNCNPKLPAKRKVFDESELKQCLTKFDRTNNTREEKDAILKHFTAPVIEAYKSFKEKYDEIEGMDESTLQATLDVNELSIPGEPKKNKHISDVTRSINQPKFTQEEGAKDMEQSLELSQGIN
jgi:hypothetical protein